MQQLIKRNLPNFITTIRFFISIAFPFLFLNGYVEKAIIFFAVGSVSDALDGFLARKWKTESAYGKMLDPIADKTLSGGALILSSLFINPILWLMLLLEGLISIVNVQAFIKNKKSDGVAQIGRIKTALLFPTILITLISTLNTTINYLMYPLFLTTILLQLLTINEYNNMYKKTSNYDNTKKSISSNS